VFGERLQQMKIVIGLFQDKQDAAEVYRRRLQDVTPLTEVGPFFSKEQALTWLKEIQGHVANSEVALLPERQVAKLQWYGFTFEE